MLATDHTIFFDIPFSFHSMSDLRKPSCNWRCYKRAKNGLCKGDCRFTL